MKPQSPKNAMKFTLWALLVLAFGVTAGIFRAVAFTGPVVGAGTGAGAIGTDAAGNVSIGTSTTDSATKLLVVGSTTNSSAYGLQVWNSAKTTLLSVRNDGAVSVPGPLTATVNASNISAGQFAAGNFSFQGNVGVGTTTPSSQLVLSGSAGVGTPVQGGGTFNLMSTTNGVGDGGALIFSNATVPVGFAGIKGFLQNGVGNSVGDLAFYTRRLTGDANLTESMRIMGSGNVGIGTTAPTSTLTVAGEIKTTSGGVRFPDGTLQTTAGGGGSQWTTTSTGVFYNGGNVGIGTTTPQRLLSLSAGGGNAFMRFTDTTASSGSGWDIGVNNGSSEFLIRDTQAAAYRMAIDNLGNVGIGTTGPGAKLHVVGTAAGTNMILDSGAAGDNWMQIKSNGATKGYFGYLSTASTGLAFLNSAGSASANMLITDSGNVGIGTTGPAAKLDITATGGSASPVIRMRQSNSTAYGVDMAIDNAVNGALVFNAVNNGSSTLAMAIERDNSNVGIGTMTPGSKLEIDGPVDSYLSGIGFTSIGAGARTLRTWMSSAGTFQLDDVTAGVARLYLNTAGKLSVAGVIESTAGGFKFPDGTTQVTAGGGGSPHTQKFTSTATWTYPAGISEAWVTICGGGGGGGGAAGGASSFGALLTANGGSGGIPYSNGTGGISGGGIAGGVGGVGSPNPGFPGGNAAGDGIGSAGGSGGGAGGPSLGPGAIGGAAGGYGGGFGSATNGSYPGGGGGGASSLGAGGNATANPTVAPNATIGYGGGGGGSSDGGGGGAQCFIRYPVVVSASVTVTIGAGGGGRNGGGGAAGVAIVEWYQ